MKKKKQNKNKTATQERPKPLNTDLKALVKYLFTWKHKSALH